MKLSALKLDSVRPERKFAGDTVPLPRSPRRVQTLKSGSRA